MIANTNIYSVWETVAILAGLCSLAGVIGCVIYACVREDKGRPILPWGTRMRVERAKAHTEVLTEHHRQDALEIKRLALSHQRTRVMKAIEADDDEEVMRLGLPSPEPMHKPYQ